MAITTQKKSSFPSHAVSDSEKASMEYGLQVARSIEHEWFKNDGGSNKYLHTKQRYNELKLYARGEQSVQKYKDELSINGDMSYLNLDWTPVPIIPKFVDIVVNGIQERAYELKAYSQDPVAAADRTKYIEDLVTDMENKDFYQHVEKTNNVSLFKSDVAPSALPESNEELSLHMQLDYKQSIEIASEEAINNVFDLNDFELLKKRLDYDITVIGIGCIKNSFNVTDGINLHYVDPVDIVHSYTESPYFEDLYYVGEVERVSIPELKKRFPSLSEKDVSDIESNNGERDHYSSKNSGDNFVNIINFEYKTYKNQVYKIKKGSSGNDKALQKDDSFNPPKDDRSRFKKVDRSIEVIYCGSKVVGHEMMLDWKLAENMSRPKADLTKCKMSYQIVAPRLYKGRAESLVSRMTSFADMIQLTHLKLQQVLSRLVPDGVYMDADGIAEIDLGNGTNYNPQEALNMYFQTGSVIGRSMTQDGDFNQGKIPIQELRSSGGNQKIASLIQTYNYYMQMMRDVTGLNEARDGSLPDANALVGVQKLAAANSNTTTRHILQAGLYLTLKTAECISLRISDILEYSNTKEQFLNTLGKFNVATLTEVSELHLHDFGIFLTLQPDEEEKALLENNIQMALQKERINLEDAIDIREVKNLKLANQLLKIRRRKKEQNDRAIQLQNIQAQTQSNAQAAQASAAAEMQKEQALAETKIKVAQAQSQFDVAKMEREAAIKKELMEFEFNLNMQLKQQEMQVIKDKESGKEDRKDERTKMQATQQSELIEQRKGNTGPKNFESKGFDNLDGFGLEQFDPR